MKKSRNHTISNHLIHLFFHMDPGKPTLYIESALYLLLSYLTIFNHGISSIPAFQSEILSHNSWTIIISDAINLVQFLKGMNLAVPILLIFATLVSLFTVMMLILTWNILTLLICYQQKIALVQHKTVLNTISSLFKLSPILVLISIYLSTSFLTCIKIPTPSGPQSVKFPL